MVAAAAGALYAALALSGGGSARPALTVPDLSAAAIDPTTRGVVNVVPLHRSSDCRTRRRHHRLDSELGQPHAHAPRRSYGRKCSPPTACPPIRSRSPTGTGASGSPVVTRHHSLTAVNPRSGEVDLVVAPCTSRTLASSVPRAGARTASPSRTTRSGSRSACRASSSESSPDAVSSSTTSWSARAHGGVAAAHGPYGLGYSDRRGSSRSTRAATRSGRKVPSEPCKWLQVPLGPSPAPSRCQDKRSGRLRAGRAPRPRPGSGASTRYEMSFPA